MVTAIMKLLYNLNNEPVFIQDILASVRMISMCRVDYPKPIVNHDVASKDNMAKMKAAYDARKAQGTGEEEEEQGKLCKVH